MFFEAHGNIDFIVTNSCVINKPNVPFNLEGIDILFASIFNQIKCRKLTKWVLLELLDENAFPTPDAMEALVNMYKMSCKLGCVKVASVCSTSLQEQFLTQVAKKANVAISFFQSEEEAFIANKEFLSTAFIDDE